MIRLSSLALLVAASTLAPAQTEAQAEAQAEAQTTDLLVPGRPLPDLELPTLDGTGTLNLSELRGTPTLLLQFASW